MAYDLGHHIIMVAYDGDDPNGSPTGELTDVFDKSFRISHNAPGAGEFKINRHSSQRTITQPDSYIRCYLDDPDTDPVFAFWVTDSSDVVLAPGEDGAEVMQKQGEGAMAYMADAIVWYEAVTTNDSAVPEADDDMWHWEDVHPAGILVRMIEEAVERGCYPDLSYDFSRTLDSNGDAWTTTITDFKVQVGTDLLTLMGYLQTQGLVFVMDPDLTLHAYEAATYGADLSATVVFTKGIDISETADRHQVSAPARSTVLVKGARSDTAETAWVEANSVAGLAEVKRRKEGFFDAQDTTHFDTLQAIGLEEIYQKLRLKAGPTNLVVLPLDTQAPLTDYNVGDIVTVDVPGIWNDEAKQITYIGFTQRSNDEYDVAVGFEDNPALRSLANSPVSAATKTPVCCPDEPFVPEISGSCFVQTASGTYPPINGATTDAAAVVYYCAPGHVYPDTKTPGHSGGWAFPTYGTGGSVDYGSAPYWGNPQQVRLIVSGDGVMEFTMASDAPQSFTWLLQHGPEVAGIVDQSGTGAANTPVSVTISSHGGTFCEHRLVIFLVGLTITCTQFGFNGATWTLGSGTITNTPGNGQHVHETTAGDAVTTTFTTNFPYYPSSLHVYVNGVLWPITETDPTTGSFTFDTAPPTGAVIFITYQATGGAGTGAGNDPEPDASTPTSGSLTDHTHAATGSGSNGGGATLQPGIFDIPATASPAQTTEGRAVWDSDDDVLTVGDGASRKTFGYEGSTVALAPGTAAAGTGHEMARITHVHPNGPQVVATLTNKSGSSVAAGDVVILDTANDTAFTTTTTGQAEVTVGIAQATIANNASGAVLLSGTAALVNVPSSMTRGRYLETHTVVKQATGSATRRAGSFGQFTTAGTTPSAVIWGQTDQTASGGGSSLTVEEVDGSPTDSAVTKIVFPNGTLGIASHVATYTPIAASTDDPVADIFGTPDTAFEFSSSSLAGLTAIGSPTTEDANTTIPGCLYYKDSTSTAAWMGRYMASPSMPFTAITKVIDADITSNFNGAGLIVGVANPATGAFVTCIIAENGGRKINAEKFTNRTTFSSTLGAGVSTPNPNSVYLGVVANSTTSIDYYWSFNGRSWRKFLSANNPSLTVASIGIAMKAENTNGFSCAFDYFRIWNSAKTFP